MSLYDELYEQALADYEKIAAVKLDNYVFKDELENAEQFLENLQNENVQMLCENYKKSSVALELLNDFKKLE